MASYDGGVSSYLQIRHVPDEARRVLKSRAAARGESVNSYLLRLIAKEVARPTVGEVVAGVERRDERAQVSSVEVIRLARDERSGDLRDDRDR